MTLPDDLRSQLLNRETLGLDAHTLATIAVVRQRRRMRLLAATTVILWLLAALIIPGLLMPMHALINSEQDRIARDAATASTHPAPSPAVVAEALLALDQKKAVAQSAAMAISTTSSLLAALATVWLVMTVRRNVLDQVNLSLAALSEQLKRLESPRP